MKRHALFVGVDDYADPSIEKLAYPAEDAAELASVFRHLLKFDRVVKLINPRHSPDVVDAVKDLKDGLGAGDLFLFFFAGHGFRVKENHVLVCARDEYADLEDGYAGLPVGQLKKWMRGSWNRMLVLDACQNDIRATRGNDLGVTSRDLKCIHAPDTDASGAGFQIVVTSCSEGQKALEVSDLKHGLFTSAFLDSVTSLADARRRIDLESLRTDLGSRMRGLVARYWPNGEGCRQEPMFTMPLDAGGVILLDGSVHGDTRPSLAACPSCFRNVPIERTYNCAKCGKKYVCETCWDREHRCCPDCAAKARKAAAERLWDGKTETFTLPGGVKMEMVYVAPGAFQMGNESGDDDEKPVHPVRLTKGYWIGKYPVTQRQWTALVSANGVSFTKLPTAWFSVWGGGSARVAGMDTSEFPMESVSWEDCDALVKALNRNEKGGRTWSLPTEAQWEFAARGGNKSRGYTYSGGDNLDALGWYYENSGIRRLDESNWDFAKLDSNKYKHRTHSVREKDVGNELGIVGMSGNVWEWCYDWYDEDYYSRSPEVDPDPCNRASGGHRVLRGGGWIDYARNCRSAYRGRDVPGFRHGNYGFRLCCSAGPRGQETE